MTSLSLILPHIFVTVASWLCYALVQCTVLLTMNNTVPEPRPDPRIGNILPRGGSLEPPNFD